MKRNDKYIGWALSLYLLTIPLSLIGVIVLGVTHSVIGVVVLFSSAVSLIVGLVLKSKDDTLNKDFDKEEHDKEQWLEYKRLKDKFDNNSEKK